MFGDMLSKLQEMRTQMNESRARLDTITVTEELQGIRIHMNGNRKLLDLQLPKELCDDPEELAELLVVALNRVLDKAEQVNQAEMAGAAKGMLPGFPGFGS